MSPLLISTSLVHIMTKNKMCTAPCACSALNACTALQTRSLLMLWLLSCCRRRRVTDPSFCFALHKIITKKLEKSKRLVVSAVVFLRIRQSSVASSDPASGEGGNVQPEAFPGSPGHGFRERPFSSTKSLLQECLRRRALW